ncbi:hypothetical protein BJ997_001549 [Cryobacterium roopkundense]|uniref:Uncharacterized protein n=1 Tax=Cryobacterium roopkundense TaxID=1001240 RepID=A0A7W9E3E9_9MICO|nr:hypothetical protein [Cryobacterium roopkundense]
MPGSHKIHLGSDSGFCLCGVIRLRLTSGERNDVACHLCRKNA